MAVTEFEAHCRTEKRERQREAKAEVAAQLEKSIEKELLERLQKGVYPTDIVNINMKEYEKVRHTCIAVRASVAGHRSELLAGYTCFPSRV